MNTTIPDAEIARIKEGNPLNEYLPRRGIDLHGNGRRLTALCPFHAENTPSFTVNLDGGYCHCFGCGWSGDVIKLEQEFSGDDFRTCCERLANGKLDASGGDWVRKAPTAAPKRKRKRKQETSVPPTPPPDLHEGTNAELAALAELRKLDIEALWLATKMGVLQFGTVGGFHCWLVTDKSGRCINARQLDGGKFPKQGQPEGFKSKALQHSRKKWPLGIEVEGFSLADFDTLLVFEGEADLLAAYHFIDAATAADADVDSVYRMLPVAILGSTTNLAPEALKLFKDKLVRIYPHADENGTGSGAAKKWEQQLIEAGATVDAFDFSGLTMENGKPICDLNDCTSICDADSSELEGLLP